MRSPGDRTAISARPNNQQKLEPSMVHRIHLLIALAALPAFSPAYAASFSDEAAFRAAATGWAFAHR